MLNLNNFNIEIKYIKKARRATIRLKPNKVIYVTAPFGVKQPDIEKFVISKTKWILEKYSILESVYSKPILQFTNGASLPFYGKELILKIIEGPAFVFEKDNELFVSLPKNKLVKEIFIKSALIKWYQNKAVELIKARVTHYSQILGVTPKSISIKNYRARWGACSSKKDLIFNWQIVTFNQNLFDYVIAHEVCHMKEMNHSTRFYEHLTYLGFNKREIQLQFKHLRNIF